MSKVWPWLGGIVVGIAIVALLVGVRETRQAYWIARGAVVHHALVSSHPVNRPIQRSPGR